MPACRFSLVAQQGPRRGLDIVLFFSALRETSVANATVIGALQPILLAPIGVRLFGEQLGKRVVVWSVVAVAGTSVVVLGATGVPEWSPRGDLLAVGASPGRWSPYAAILAATAGTVAYAGWANGYGNLTTSIALSF